MGVAGLASLGGFTFGYDQGVIANILVMSSFKSRFLATAWQVGLISKFLKDHFVPPLLTVLSFSLYARARLTHRCSISRHICRQVLQAECHFNCKRYVFPIYIIHP